MEERQHRPYGSKSATNGSTSLWSPEALARLAWAAGFIDGEGCIHIAKQRYRGERSDTYRLGVYVTQNDKSVLEHLRDVVGIDAPIFPVKRARNHKRQCYTLNFSGKGAQQLLSLLEVFFRRKRAEAAAALAFCTEGLVGKRFGRKAVPPDIVATREHYFRLLKQLK